jgi:hypothetical protein
MVLVLNERDVPCVLKASRLKQILGDMLSVRKEFQRDADMASNFL